MKMHYCFIVIFAWVAVSLVKAQNQPSGLHKPTQAEIDAWHAKYVERQSALPLDQRHTVYLIVDKQTFTTAPSFLDEKTMTAYRWKGVVLQPSQVPDLIGTRDGSGMIVPIDPNQMGYQIKDIAPPVRYRPLAAAGQYSEGYYDRSHRIFYQWSGVTVDQSQLPVDAAHKHLILSAKDVVNISTVNPPTQ